MAAVNKLRIVYSDPKTGRSAQKELEPGAEAAFLNRKIGEIIDGSLIGLSGYKFRISGGSDSSGFPMKKGIEGPKKTTMMSTISMSGRQKGRQRRMTVRGDTVSADIAQLNLSVVEYGEKPVDEVFPKKEEAKEAANATEKK
jgi:small subunit ribosomal protein S6e